MSALDVLREMAAKYHRLAREAKEAGELGDQVRYERMAHELDKEVQILNGAVTVDLEDLIGE